MITVLENSPHKGQIILLENLINSNLQDYIYDICQNDLAYNPTPTTNPPDIFRRVNDNVKNNIYDDFFLCCNLKIM